MSECDIKTDPACDARQAHLLQGHRRPQYHVIFEDSDTRIRPSVVEGEDCDEGRFETFREAREAAVEYLEDLIESCQSTLDQIRGAGTFEEYLGR